MANPASACTSITTVEEHILSSRCCDKSEKEKWQQQSGRCTQHLLGHLQLIGPVSYPPAKSEQRPRPHPRLTSCTGTSC